MANSFSPVTIIIVVIIISGLNISLLPSLHISKSELEVVARPVPDEVSSSPTMKLTEILTPASDIVHRTFNNTFAHLYCPKRTSMKECLVNMFGKMQSKNLSKNQKMSKDDDDSEEWSSSSSRAQHWWFQSMIRDSGNLGGDYGFVFGPWHVGQATDPNVSMCMIEKIGIKRWTTLFTSLNGNAYYSRKTRSDEKHEIELPASNEGYPSFVVLRDPLERFLSAYLDKCVDSFHRKEEGHCKPNEIYMKHEQLNHGENPLTTGYSFGGDDDKLKDRNMSGQRKTLFSMYVDTMPLKWDLHFFPQSLYCNGIYRFIDDYDVILHMGPRFDNDLEKLGRHYGGRFEEELKKVFDYPSKLKKKEGNANGVHSGIETKASEKVMQYYTPRSLRKVLEYVSIDYTGLDLKIPDSAEEMLREDQD